MHKKMQYGNRVTTFEKVRRSSVKGPGPSAPQLHCREATFLSVEWDCQGQPVFAVEVRNEEDGDWRPWGTVGLHLTDVQQMQ
jgi:hypothetical protein